MKNRILGTLLLITLSCASRQALYSPFTQRLMQKVIAAEQDAKENGADIILTESDCKKFLIIKSENEFTVNGTILVSGAFNPALLAPLGIQIRSERENSLNLSIPVLQLDDLGKIKHILRIEIDSPVKIK